MAMRKVIRYTLPPHLSKGAATLEVRMRLANRKRQDCHSFTYNHCTGRCIVLQ